MANRKVHPGPSFFDAWDDVPTEVAKPKRKSRKKTQTEEIECPQSEQTNGPVIDVDGDHPHLCPPLDGAPAPAAESPSPDRPLAPSVTVTATPASTSSSESSPPSNGLAAALKAAAQPAASKRQPTAEQQAGIDTAVRLQRQGGGVLIFQAGAGCGKTTELVMLEENLRGIGQYTAFNAPLVAESKGKFKRCGVNTFHSLAFRAVGNRFEHRLGGQRVRSDVVAEMLHLDALPVCVTTSEGPRIQTLSASYLASLVTGALRRFCQSADRAVAAEHIQYIDGIDMPDENGKRTYANNELAREYLLPFAERAWVDVSSPDGQLPFTHDYYVKVWELDSPVIAADYVLADEVQDLSPVMLSVFRQQRGCLVVMVGDSAQQIYEWRGAVDALKAFPEAPRCMLSQSFRFGEAIASLANQVLDCLVEKTPLRLKGLPSIPSKVEALARPTAILTRTNACAIQHLFLEVEAGRRPFLVGGGKDVVAFVEAAGKLQAKLPTSHPDLACFASWLEVQEYVQHDPDGEDLKLMVKLIDEFGCAPILAALRAMPKEADADVVISTAHKSKGREWDAVRLAADFPTRSKASDSDLKLLYVALTRARLVLDVTTCPFFTGQDALVIQRPKSSTSGQAPTNGQPPAEAKSPPTTFTFNRGKNDSWLIRGPEGYEGKAVEVTRKDGSKSTKRLGKAVATFTEDQVSLYEIV